MKETKRSFLTSCIALLLCFTMLMGSTFAWFTDVVTSSGNKIKSGNLDLDLQLKDKETGSYSSINENSDPVFDYDNWEPGYTDVKVLKVFNAGSLSFKWVGNFVSREQISKLAEVIEVYVKTSDSDIAYPDEREELTSDSGWKSIGTLDTVIDSTVKPVSGQLLSGESDYFAIALRMQETAGNEYQDMSLGAFDIAVHASQYTAENDSFGNDYDQNSQWPSGVISGSITASGAVTTDDQGKVASPVTLISSDGKVSAVVPAGTQLEAGATNVTVIVSPVNESQANVTLNDTEKMLPVDVHIDGVAENNNVAIPVYLAEWLEVGLNIGNYKLYHVEDGITNEMTLRNGSATAVHNDFDYDPATGDVTLYLASFSEVAMVADTTRAWGGEFDYSWYDADATELTIANADQLAAFGAIVGGMAKDENGNFLINYTDSDGDEHHNDFFEDKTVKLLADINLGDAEAENNPDLIFYPIGYWNSEGTYEKTGTAISSGFYAFKGTFDGNGNTISNFYQNTWEMKGDHDWYEANLQYYRDGMGLFGKILGGTVKNLTVDNFSCDSEIGTSGVIAAYADSVAGKPATFENITITNCNPRVYNIGNGGIVGCAGWYSRNNSLGNDKYTNAVTFRNITVDQTNTISALWGSWGVSCAGILGQYYPNSNCGIKLENCHVAAVIDVNNDVCSNYQYYWYRYAGMFIGTIRANTTDANGYTVADTTGVTAKDCTYTMGDWNEYWYCEIVANSLASYTHDHQFSRLEKITSKSEIQDANGNWNREGHFVIPAADNSSATCYHIFKNSNGELYQHFHDKADESNPNIYESFDLNGDGKLNDLKEDRQCYFIPFNQLLTGLDMGIKAHTEFEGIKFVENGTVKSVKKFDTTGNNEIVENSSVKIGYLFKESGNGAIASPTVQVYVSPAGEESTVSAIYSGNSSDWKEGTLQFSGKGSAKVVITDYYYCTSTVLYVTVGGVITAYDKFDSKFTGDFLYRVGNQNAVKLDSLFKAKDGVSIGDVSVTVDTITGASGTYTSNATRTNGTIKFNGTGVVKVTITDNNYCTPTELYLEVVDATNVTGLSGTISGNVVLLNDCGLSSLTVSGRNTVYGNGFTATYTGNGQYLNNGLKQGVITVSENGTLDNLRIKASIYPASYLYYEEAKKGPSSVEGDKTRYHYQLSAVAASGKATISNCYIYGGRNNIFIGTGDVTVKDTILECGTVSNIQIQSNASHTVTIENVTTIQYQVNPTIDDTSKVMLGAGILVGPETTENPSIVLNGAFKQYNWVSEDDKNAASDEVAQEIIKAALNATAYNHTINGKTASNLGIIYMNEIEPNVKNNTGLPYASKTISISGVNGKAYSLQGATAEQIYSDYENADRSTVNGLYIPQFKYDDDLGGQYIEKDSGDEHCYREGDTINVMFPSGDTKELDLAKLVNIAKYAGQNLNLEITVKDENGNAVTVTNGKVSLSDAGKYTVTYTVTDTLFYDKDGNKVSDTKKYSWNVTVSVSLKDTAIPDARFEFDATKQKMGYYKPSWGDVKQYLPFLAGLKIYDYNGKAEYLRFDGSSDFNKIASITITGYASNKASVEIKLTDGGVINTQFLARANSGGGSTYTGKIKTSNNTVYFVTDSGTSNKDTTTTAAYWYVDFYKFTGNNGVAIQSGQQTFNSTGSSASTPSGNFSTSIKYTVTYDANGGNCGQTVGYATSAATAVTLATPTRSGYIFAGWYTAASGGTRVGGAGDSYTPSANITLYAQWGKPCTVTYNANGGSCGTASEKYTGTALTLPTPTRDGYWFIGWYDAATGGNKIGDAGATYDPGNEITLYARWQEKVEYTVTYNANGGTCSTAPATYQGTALTLPTPTRTGYTFNGWFTAASGGTKIEKVDAYIPSSNITLYAQWQINSYTIDVTTNNATVKVNGTEVNNEDTVSIQYDTQVTVEVTYSETESQSTTIEGTDGTTYTSSFKMPAQNVTINATSTAASSGCTSPDTLITLADGSQVRVDSLKGDEMLLVWNMETGKLDFAPIMFIDSETEAEYEIVHLYFSDGTDVKVIYEHGFWDYDLNKYVYLDRYADKYIGHTFAKQNGDKLEKVTLTDVVIETELTTAWSPVTVGHLCYFVNGMLSMPGGVGGLFNILEVDPETMTYDYEQLAKDIETYGLFTYEELNAICPLTEEMFNAAGGAYLKISIGKGNLTIDELINMINRYSKFI